MRLFSLMVIALCLSAHEMSAQSADSVPPPRSDAYLDAAAAEHVRLARERRQVADLSIEAYKALTKERMSAGLRGIRRDRLLYRREVAGRIEWSREGTGRIEILGAREAIPVAIKGVQLPDDLDSFMPHLAFDPANTQLLIDWGDNEFVRHPFAPGAERYYKYRTGSTTSIQLPDGRIVRLVELEIIPRSVDSHNITGSFWLEASTHAVVQAAFRLSRSIDIIKDFEDEHEEDDDGDIPGFLQPLTATVDYVTIEYGLYDLKWWMPRSMLFEGSVRAGFIRVPMQYERTYSNYEIVGSDTVITAPVAEVLARDSARRAATDSCRNTMSVNVKIGGRPPAAAGDSTQTVVTQCGRWEITMSSDTAALLASKELPADVFASGEQLISEAELRQLGERIEALDGGPLLLSQPVTSFSALSISHMRYNRVEGLSLPLDARVDYGAYKGSAQLRIGVADLQPGFDVSAEKIGQNHALKLTAYRRLNGFDPFRSPFTIGASASALLLGRDEADYYRSLGVELTARPAGSAASWYSARLFAERESAAEKETDFSIRHLLNGDVAFRENIPAQKLNAYGGEVTLRYAHGLDPEGFRFGGELYGHGAMGTSEFARGAATLRFGIPLPGAFTGALESAAGLTSTGAPIQHLWYIGGANTARGYDPGTLAGETFWRGRAEIGYGLPAVRIVGFADAAWAGARDSFGEGKPLLSAGAGVSMLDGILRVDVARALRAPKGWGVTLYYDAAI